MQMKMGRLSRVLVADGSIAATLIRVDDPADRARKNQLLEQKTSSLLARTMAVCAYFASFLKEEGSFVRISIKGGTTLEATADAKLHITGHADGTKEFRDALFTYTRFSGGIPATGAVNVSGGDIRSAFLEFYRASEQRLIDVSFGERYQSRGYFSVAGAIFLEALPGVDREAFLRLSEKLPQSEELCDLLLGEDPAEKLFGVKPLFNRRIIFQCRCNREKAALAVKTMGFKEALNIVKRQGAVEVRCPECGKSYLFHEENIMEIFKQNE